MLCIYQMIQIRKQYYVMVIIICRFLLCCQKKKKREECLLLLSYGYNNLPFDPRLKFLQLEIKTM